MGFYSAPEAASKPIASAPEIRESLSLAILDHCCSRLSFDRDVPRLDHRSPRWPQLLGGHRCGALECDARHRELGRIAVCVQVEVQTSLAAQFRDESIVLEVLQIRLDRAEMQRQLAILIADFSIAVDTILILPGVG